MPNQEGKTTRIADKCIQDLFNNGTCLVVDHEGRGQRGVSEGTRKLLSIISRRLSQEHGVELESSDGVRVSETPNGYTIVNLGIARNTNSGINKHFHMPSCDEMMNLRAALDMTMEEISEMSGVSSSVISRMEAGANVKYDSVRRLFELYQRKLSGEV